MVAHALFLGTHEADWEDGSSRSAEAKVHKTSQLNQ
jgi:hypothetical protein